MSSALERMMKFSTRIAMLVSSQNKVNTRTREAILPRAVRKTLVEAAQLAAERGLAFGVLAELSLRLPGQKLAINQAGTWFAHASDDDFTIASLAHGRPIIAGQEPAWHVGWHRLIYNITEAQVILICQPVACVRIAGLKLKLDAQILPDAARAIGKVGYAQPEETDIQSAVTTSRALLITGVGLLVWGDDLNQVIGSAETVDHWCQVQLAEYSLERGNA